ncbi:hypothetical protein ES332_A04G013000v1 [Gossypium tomentosum]|uniref:Uncharacterized protein n=2 Tax=Gossypium TaxID=3633 RepID=A0ABR0Q5D0_GOSAR|nr:hypothetical protein PVK06_018339 [Gossypium arboreum]TYI31827.1 hypothetical protein ES332_A04G013000v1 [Gossypium tomentosum]
MQIKMMRQPTPPHGNGISSMTNPIPIDDDDEESNPSMDEDEKNSEDLTTSKRDLVMNAITGDLPSIPPSSLTCDNHALAIIPHSSNPIKNPFLAPILDFGPCALDVEVDDSIRAQCLASFIRANEQLQNWWVNRQFKQIEWIIVELSSHFLSRSTYLNSKAYAMTFV